MRLIDADALVEKLNLAISMMSGMMKMLNAEDDEGLQMELKAYREIRDGIKEEPTIKELETGCVGCRHGRFGDPACDGCARTFLDNYEAEEQDEPD